MVEVDEVVKGMLVILLPGAANTTAAFRATVVLLRSSSRVLRAVVRHCGRRRDVIEDGIVQL